MALKVAQTYVWHGTSLFLVSTINRESSSMESPVEFTETIVWRLNDDGSKGEQMVQEEDCKNCIGVHLNLVDLFHHRGSLAKTKLEEE